MSTSTKPKSKKPPLSHKRVHVPLPDASTTSLPPIPSALIFRRGPVAHSLLTLVSDLRLLFSPHSSQRLQERKANTMKDFLAVAPPAPGHPLPLPHPVRRRRQPAGHPHPPRPHPHLPRHRLLPHEGRGQSPEEAAWSGEGVRTLPPRSPQQLLCTPPPPLRADAPPATGDVSLHLPLVSTALQHMFPPLHLPTLVLSHCRRVVLFHFDPATQLIDMRHYLITASPTNVSRVVRHLLKGKLR